MPTIIIEEIVNNVTLNIEEVVSTVNIEVSEMQMPGYTPIKGVDYFDGVDGYTPIKGVDYFDGTDGVDGITPVKGVDYFDGIDGVDGVTQDISGKVDKVLNKSLVLDTEIAKIHAQGSDDETTATIKSKLGITILSGDNTGDQDLSGKVDVSLLGAVNGVAELDASGFVKNTQLPSYVDDVLEFANLASFPVTGESGKIYIAIDTNKTYRWSGTVYAIISETITIGEVKADTEIASAISLKHASLTISATPNGLSLTGQELALQLASTTQTGALSDTDWNTFNGKAPASGSANYIQNQNASAQSANMWISGTIKTPTTLEIGLDVTIANKNKQWQLLKNIGGSNLATYQYNVWNGTAYVAANGYGFGHQALSNNTGAYSNGFGYTALQNNTGASSNGFGYAALYNNTGTYSNGFGYAALYYNNYPNVVAIGYQSTLYFNPNAATAKTFTEANIDATAHTITITAHGFGTVNSKVNLKFTGTGAPLPTGLANNGIYQFTITDANTLYLVGITATGTTVSGTITKDYDISNAVQIGTNVNATGINEVIIGYGAVSNGANTVTIGGSATVRTYLAGLNLKAGTATAGTAPLKFTSGTLMTTPEVGAIEFLTDAYYATITTGAARKQLAFTGLAGVKTYYVSDTSGGATTRKLTFTDGILTAEI